MPYLKRRQELFNNLPKSSLAIIKSRDICFRNNDADYPYRQDSNFYYLTGFNESNAILILLSTEQLKTTILFNQSKDLQMELWSGPVMGAAALEALQVDQVFNIEDFNNKLPNLLNNIQEVLCPFYDNVLLENIFKVLKKINAVAKLSDLHKVIAKKRLIKDKSEIELMRQAAKISSEAHKKLMQKCSPGLYEYQLQAEFIYHCSNAGAANQAYNPIVASGNNACVLHYVSNRDQLQANQLLLVDAGAEYENYAADITRTYPVNGKFNENQKLLYEIVLQAQLAGILVIKPGVAFVAVQEAILNVLVPGLIKLGLLTGSVVENLANKSYLKFYMHKSGHWLGLDVHDAGAYQDEDNQSIKFQENMVLTVEPGIYINKYDFSVAEEWRGIGIRIEDDVLVTKNGSEILSMAPKTIAEIEAVMQN